MRISRHRASNALVVLFALALTRCGSSPSPVSPPTPTAIAQVSGNNQTGPAGQALAQPLVIKVTSASGAGIAGVSVTLAVTAGGGSLSAASASTNAQGQASVVWTLGAQPVSQAASATAAGLTGSPVTFAATGTPNGTISGTITLANSFLAPPRPKPVAVDGLVLAPPVHTKTVTSRRMSAQAARRGSIAPLQPTFTPDELIVTFRPEALSAPPIGSRAIALAGAARIQSAAIRSRLSAANVSGLEIAGVSPAILAARVRITDPTRIDAAAAFLRNDPAVAAVERNSLVYVDAPGATIGSGLATTLPNEQLYPFQAWHYGLIDLPAAWDIVRGSASVLVAVVDNGIRFDHPAVAGNLSSDGYDFVSSLALALCGGGTLDNAGDGDGYDTNPTQLADYSYDPDLNCASGPNSIGGHGLHVAGTIGAVGNDGIGVTGVNWTVRIRPIRALGIGGVGTNYDIAQGIR